MSASSAIVPAAEQPAQAPVVRGDPRAELAAEFLRGAGVEIGALHQPMPVPGGAGVTYVDRMTVEDLRAHYPELAELPLTRVDVVDDGERLETFEDESVDFMVANHFLEHCEDPIGTIETHLRKLRPGGVLFYAVPDKRYTFDFRRPRTTLAHVIADYENGPDASRRDHYLEWERMVYEPGNARAGRVSGAQQGRSPRARELLDSLPRVDPGGPAGAVDALPRPVRDVRVRDRAALGPGEHCRTAKARRASHRRPRASGHATGSRTTGRVHAGNAPKPRSRCRPCEPGLTSARRARTGR